MSRGRKNRNRGEIFSSRMKAFSSFIETYIGGVFRSGWKVISGSWSVVSGKSSTSTASSLYPIQTTQMSDPNVTIDIKNPGMGTGSSLWVTDSGNWWAVVVQQEECVACGGCTSYSYYNPCATTNPAFYNYYGCNTNPVSYNTVNCTSFNATFYNSITYGGGNYASGGNCRSYNASNCKAFGYSRVYGSYYVFGCNGGYNTSYCSAYNTTFYNTINISGGNYASGGNCASTSGGNYASGGNCANYFGGNYASGGNCASTSGGECISNANTYPRYLKFIRFASNAVTEIASVTLDSLSSAANILGLKVQISNATKGGSTATVTAKAYSDTDMISQVGNSLVYNATGVVINTNYGIIASPSSYNEDKSIGDISIS